MKTLSDGPYNYRTNNRLPPIVCDIVAGYVSEVGDAHMRPLSHYNGDFVRLAEVDAAIANFVRRVYERAERNMEITGTVSGAHWNAIRVVLAEMGIAEPGAADTPIANE